MAGIEGAALKNLREKSGASRSQFAEQNKISVQYLCDIEEGRRKLKRNPGLIKRFAESLAVPTFWLQPRDPAAVAAEETSDREAAAVAKTAAPAKPGAKRTAKATRTAPK